MYIIPKNIKTSLVLSVTAPFEGSGVANLAKQWSDNPQIKASVKSHDNGVLQELQDDWNFATKDIKIDVACAYEKYPYKDFGSVIVDRDSATKICNRDPWAIEKDHKGIVKPKNETDRIHKWVKDQIYFRKESGKRELTEAEKSVNRIVGEITNISAKDDEIVKNAEKMVLLRKNVHKLKDIKAGGESYKQVGVDIQMLMLETPAKCYLIFSEQEDAKENVDRRVKFANISMEFLAEADDLLKMLKDEIKKGNSYYQGIGEQVVNNSERNERLQYFTYLYR